MLDSTSFIDDTQKSTTGGSYKLPSSESSDHLIYGNSASILALAWLFLMFTPAAIGTTPYLGVDETFALRIFFLLAAALSYLAARSFSEQLYTERGLKGIAVASLILAPMATIGALLQAPFSILALLWCVSGVGYAGSTVLNYRFSSSLSHSSLVLSTTISFALAALLACLVVFLTPVEFRLVVMTVMPIASIGLIMLDDAMNPKGVRTVSLADSRKRSHVSWKASGAVVCHSVCLGFAVYIIGAMSVDGHYWIVVVVALGVFAVSIAAAVEDISGSGRLMDEGVQLRYTLVLAMAAMAPIFTFERHGLEVSSCLLVVFFIVQEMTNKNAIAENVKLDRLNLVHTCACSRPVNAIGLAVGYACGFAAIKTGSEMGAPGGPISIAFLILMVISILSAALFLNRYPSASEEVRFDMPLNQEEDHAITRHSSWKVRCDAFGDSIGLSPRQRDVFMLLTKGHNASYIERKLVISNHTVKSHTYSIYQKAGVHSRQELIEKVETFDLEEKKY